MDANPEAHEHARLRYRAANVRFERGLVESVRRAGRRGRVPADDRAPAGPGRRARALPRARGRARRRVRLHPQRAHARAEGRRRSGNPWHVHEYRHEEFEELCRGHFADVQLYGLFHARKLRAHELALRCRLGPRARALGLTARFYERFTPAIASLDFVLRGAGEASSTARSTSSRCAGRERRRRARRAGDRPAHAHALRRGLRHVAVRRGVAVGGDGRLLPAAARAARRGRAAHALAHAGAVRPARGAGGRRALRALRRGGTRRSPTSEDAAGLRAGGHEQLARELERALAATTSRRSRACAGAAGICSGRSRRTRSGPPRPPTRCCRCSRATRACACRCRAASSSHRRRFGDWRGGFWLPECAYAPWLERRSRTPAWRATCVELTGPLGLGAAEHLRPLVTDAGVVLVPIDRSHDLARVERAGLPGPRRYRDYHRHTVHHHNPWNNAGEAYDREDALALARAHAADFVARTLERIRAAADRGPAPAAPGAGRVRARHGAARALVVRGDRVAARRSSRSARARVSRWCASTTRSSAIEPVATPAARGLACGSWGERRRPVDVVGARASPTWPSRRALPSSRCCAAGEAPTSAGARAARAAGERLAVHGHPRAGGALSRASASRGTGARSRPRSPQARAAPAATAGRAPRSGPATSRRHADPALLLVPV